jgi:uncharacterized repeat protein (TIGR03803 family)
MTGLYTSPVVVPSASSSITVTATSEADSTKSGSATVALCYPLPTVSGVSPSTVLVDSDQTTLNVVVTGATPASVVFFGVQALATTFVSPTQVTAILPASFETTEGIFPIYVNNPPPAGGMSSTSAQFEIVGTLLTVDVTGLPAGSPAAVTVAGPAGLNVPVSDTRFIDGPEGIYTVTAGGVAIGKTTYYATAPTQSVALAKGQSGTVVVNYYNIVPTTTKVLDNEGMAGLQKSPDGSTITMSSESAVAASLQPGDTLASAATSVIPYGLLVKILTVSLAGGTVTATVQPATLEDAFEQATFSIAELLNMTTMNAQSRARLGARVLSRKDAISAGLPVPLDSATDPCAGNPDTIVVPYAQSLFSKQWGGSGNATGSARLTLDATLEICPSFTFTYTINSFSLTSLNATASLGHSAHITLQGSGSISIGDGPVYSSTPMEFGPWPVVVGGVPLMLTITATPFVGGTAQGNAGFTTGVSESAQGTAGLSYANGLWSIINTNSSPTFTQDPLSLDAGVDLKGYAGVKLALVIDGVVAPNISPDVYLDFNADTSSKPWWTLTTGLEAQAGVDVTILGKSLLSYESQTFNIFSLPVAQANPPAFSLGAVSPTLASLSPASATVGSPGFNLIVVGSGFVPDSIVYVNGVPLATTYVNTTELTAVLPATEMLNAGVLSITVSNPDTSGAASQALNFTVAPLPCSPALVGLTLNPTSINAGQSANGTLTLSCAPNSTVSVPLSSSNSAVLVVPPTATVQAGSTTGTFGATAASSVAAATNVLVTATYGGVAKMATVGVNPPLPPCTLSSLAFNPNSISAGETSTGTLALTCPTASEITAILNSSDSNALSVPASITISAGSSSQTFIATALATGQATITATYNSTSVSTTVVVEATGPYSVIAPFAGSNGTAPQALIMGADGMLYGVAQGGTGGYGLVFQVDPAAQEIISVHSFDGQNGSNPLYIIQASNGNFYVVVQYLSGSNSGAILEMDPTTFAITTLHALKTDGSEGVKPFYLLEGYDGALYGLALFGGAGTPADGVVFKCDTQGNFSVLHSFSGPDGANLSSLIQGVDGYLYGTATANGPDLEGEVFRIAPDGSTFSIFHPFKGGNDGGYPVSIIQTATGEFYGLEQFGAGALFRLDVTGNATVVVNFTAAEGSQLNVLTEVQTPSGALLLGTAQAGGTATGAGTIFEFNPTTSEFSVIYSFSNNSGDIPYGHFAQSPSGGPIYGITGFGAPANSQYGVVFEITP